MRAKDFLTEFAPEGFERYSLYTGDGVSSHLVDRFSSLAAAREEVEFIWQTDPETRLVVWLIKNLNDEVVWYYDPQEIADAPRYQFRKKSDLDEMAGEIAPGIRQVLDKKGYELLGDGIDKEAYLEPGTGQVLVIFGYGAGKNKFSKDQMMFVDWAKYCQQNQSNPHLPKFSGWESFDFQGKRYLQIRMEPLQELSDYLRMIIANLEEVAKYSKSKPKTAYKKLAKFANHDLLDAGEPDDLDHQAVVKNLGGKQAAYNLLKTVYDVKKFGKKHGFNIDLHSGNYMQRANGTIVVNDPFVLSFDIYQS
jgi:hypothetical protein